MKALNRMSIDGRVSANKTAKDQVGIYTTINREKFPSIHLLVGRECWGGTNLNGRCHMLPAQ